MAYRLAIFDLDGTILDSLRDLQGAANAALAAHGFPVRTLEEVRSFVGNGVRMLLKRAAPAGLSEAELDALTEDFHVYYAVHFADFTLPYPGIPELFSALREQGIGCAIVSNKPDYGVQLLKDRFFAGLCDYATGERPGIARKPDPSGVFAALRALGVEKKDAVYIGDSSVDVATAANAGIDCIAVSYGFQSRKKLVESGARVIADTAAELLPLITG